MKYEMLTKKQKLLIKHKPLPRPLINNLDNWFSVELTYNSNAIEGNTLTRQETALVVEKGVTVGGKTVNEHLEATNHALAIDWVKKKVNASPKHIIEKDILNIHKIILSGIDNTNAGCYRNVSVRISGSSVIMPNPLKVPELMKKFVLWLKQPQEIHPVEFAAEAHYRLVTIHPFTDGNGRTARLLMNMILLMQDYPITIIRKRDRLAYVNSLEKAQLGGSKDDYLQLVANSVNRSLDIYLKSVNGDQTDTFDKDLKLLKIGELAKTVGTSNATIRYWTKEGLLKVAEITASGYQLYSTDMIERIKKINALKAKRYTLQEIKERVKTHSS
jgi:Fic family protein